MPSIADPPIDWTRDPNLQEVPHSASVNTDVTNRWNEINRTIFDGVPIEYAIAGVEEALVARHLLIGAGTLDPNFDWKHDFELARFNHRFHLNNIDYVKNKRTSYLQFWRDFSTSAIDHYQAISLNGQKTIYLVHGAVALGALNVLTKVPSPPASLLVTAKLAVAFAAIGIILVGAGQLASFYYGAPIAWKVRAKLVGDVKWKKALAVPRYLRRYRRFGVWADRAVYASVIWCGVYLGILLILLLSS